MSFLVKLVMVASIFLISLSVFFKIKYFSFINEYFINKKTKALDAGKKFTGIIQKFFALIGILITFPVLIVLMTEDLPNELNAMTNGISGDEYADLVLYTKSDDMAATVKEYQEYKKNGFETARDYGLAKKMGILKIEDYKKYQDDEFKKYMSEKELAEAKKRGFASVEEMRFADKIDKEQKAKAKEEEAKNEKLLSEMNSRAAAVEKERNQPECQQYYAAKKQCAAAFNFESCIDKLGSNTVYEMTCPK